MTPDSPAPVPPDGETDAPIPDWEFAGREEDRIRGAQEHAYARGFAAGRAAASPDPPDMTNMCEGESPDHKPGITPAASPDPPDHGPAIGLLRAAAVQREIAANHNHPAEMTVLMASWEGLRLAADLLEREAGMVHRCEPAPASPDERLREAAEALVVAAARAVCEPGPFRDNDDHLQWKLADAITATRSALVAADREAPDEGSER